MISKVKLSAGFFITVILSVLISFFLFYSCSQQKSTDISDAEEPIARSHKFVGDQTCQSCHAGEWEQWKGSHHDYAIGEADDEHVRGDFDDVIFEEGQNRYRFFRDDGRYMVEIDEEGRDSEIQEIEFTFGWEPLQQYLVDIGRGKYQALHIAWDTEENRWFSLHPDEEFEADDWMHWSGGAMNWNNMCADCHSTNLQQNYIAEADSFHTEWSVLNVSCEACHGPGGDHVAFMNSPESEEASRERIGEDIDLGRFTSQLDEINTCAPCHSHRSKLTDNYIHGDNYLDHFLPTLPHPDNYYADGQILEEVFVYGSFLQSKMYTEGVQCTDCHNPHSLQLRQPLTDNQLCMTCHEPEYNSPEHHFHQVNTEASQCINCHMTGRTYMGNDYRRDHSFRVPRPDQTERFGVPNACNDCHADRSAEWAAQAVEEWYGEDRPDHYSETFLRANEGERGAQTDLRELIFDIGQPEMIRATAVWYIGRFPETSSSDILADALESDSPMVRATAARAMENISADIRKSRLENLLSDSVLVVRNAAVQQLTEYAVHDFEAETREHFQNALEEYRTNLDVNQYFPQGQMNKGLFFEQQGQPDLAIEAYQTALERDPYFTPARINLAYLQNRTGDNENAEEQLRIVIDQEPEYGDAYYSLALLLAEENRMREAAEFFEQAAEYMPERSRVFYNLAIAHQTIGNPQPAEEAYLRAINLEPQNGDYRYGLVTLYMQQEEFENAYEQARILNELNPNNPQIQQLLGMIEQRLN